jgi:trimeric autotransporter adhesin
MQPRSTAFPTYSRPSFRPLTSCFTALVLLLACGVSSAQSQGSSSVPSFSSTNPGAAADRAVPGLMKFSGTARDSSSKPLNGVVGISFALYTNEVGGASLWMETQNVQADASGRYTVSLGAGKALPVELFSSGEARWLGVQIAGQPEQNRILLLSVPYALKAADAQTLGGLPPSAFVLAAPAASLTSTTSAASQEATAQPLAIGTTPVTTAGGAVNTLAKFDAKADVTNSQVFDNGTNVGIGNTAPAAKLDVSGTGIFRGALSLPATAAATSTAGKTSQPFNFTASSFSSSTLKAVNETFRWQAEPVGNNTAAPSGTLNLLFGSGTAAPTETGLKLSSKGLFTFATGQTFPGAGTITGVTTATGSGLSGGGTTGSLTLSLLKTCSTNQLLRWSGTAWACATIGGSGTVTSVALAAPASDFTVSGSPITGAGTLNLGWTVAPTGANTANAIVKRDATGSFNANIITASGAVLGNSGISSQTSATAGVAIDGFASGTGATTGVLGSTTSPDAGATGVVGLDQNTSGNVNTNGVKGVSFNPGGIGVLGSDGVGGLSNEFLSHSGSQRIGVWGDAEGGAGASAGIGVIGTSDTGIGVVAENNDGDQFPAMLAIGGNGLSGGALNGAPGMSAAGGNAACCGVFNSYGTGGDGIDATGGGGGDIRFVGIGGSFTGGTFLPTGTCSGYCGGTGIVASGGYDGNSQNQGYAAEFVGDVKVTGQLFATVKDFQIDHPLDPANKYLVHASIESSEMMNLYTGNTTTDAQGEAIVQLPEWFEALNTDFRYQLTVIGQFAQAIVAREISGHQFAVRTSLPNVKVSWQVTGVRQDAYAKAHPMVVEQEKNARERGHYIYPELYGAPREKQMGWAGPPHVMNPLKENRTRLLPSRTASVKP